jgi:hypothetical protein
MFLKLTTDKQDVLLNFEHVISVWSDGSYPGALIEIRDQETCLPVQESVDEILALLEGGNDAPR